MSDNRSEKPTPRRRQKAREEGQVLRSRELAGAAGLIAALAVVSCRTAAMRGGFEALLRAALDDTDPKQLATRAIMLLGSQTLPPLAAAAAVSAACLLLPDPALTISSKALLNFERLSPAKNLSRIFSLAALMRVAKSVLPAAVLLSVGMSLVRDHAQALVPGHGVAGNALLRALVVRACALLLLLGGVDWLLEWRKRESALRMTRHEIKQEARESDGNPHMKAKIRRLQRQMRRRRMLADAANATVVITNPTHFAVALEYRPGLQPVPTVVAKGVDAVAAQIREIAQWHGIPVVENRPLARTLYRTCALGDPIANKLYAAVAEVLAYVYRTEKKLHETVRTHEERVL